MAEAEITYYARLGPGDSPQRPSGLVRRRHTDVYPTDEVLRHDGRWHRTDVLERAVVGDLDDELIEIPASLAGEIAERWRAIVADQERELAAQGRGELGLRLAGAEPDATAQPLGAAERLLVGDYLRGAPVVVSAFGFAADPFAGGAPRIPLHIHTDGLWVWSAAVGFFAVEYGIPPEPEFLAHIRARRYRWPDVASEVLDRAGQLVAGAGP